jgi:hypothetical protein
LSINKPVFIFGVLLVFSLFFGVFSSTAQAATINTSFSQTSITPKALAHGQRVIIEATILPIPPSGYFYRGISVEVIDANGNYRTIGSNYSDPGTGRFYFSWVPDIVGTYSVTLSYAGETLAGNFYTGCQSEKNSFYVDHPSPTNTPTPVPLITPKPTSTIDNTSPTYFSTETPNMSTFNVTTEQQLVIRDLPWYLIGSVIVADIAVLLVLGVRHMRRK